MTKITFPNIALVQAMPSTYEHVLTETAYKIGLYIAAFFKDLVLYLSHQFFQIFDAIQVSLTRVDEPIGTLKEFALLECEKQQIPLSFSEIFKNITSNTKKDLIRQLSKALDFSSPLEETLDAQLQMLWEELKRLQNSSEEWEDIVFTTGENWGLREMDSLRSFFQEARFPLLIIHSKYPLFSRRVLNLISHEKLEALFIQDVGGNIDLSLIANHSLLCCSINSKIKNKILFQGKKGEGAIECFNDLKNKKTVVDCPKNSDFLKTLPIIDSDLEVQKNHELPVLWPLFQSPLSTRSAGSS